MTNYVFIVKYILTKSVKSSVNTKEFEMNNDNEPPSLAAVIFSVGAVLGTLWVINKVTNGKRPDADNTAVESDPTPKVKRTTYCPRCNIPPIDRWCMNGGCGYTDFHRKSGP